MSWRHQGCEFIYFHILLCVVDVQYQFTHFLRTYKTGTWKIDLIAMSPFMELITGNDCQPCLVQYIWKPMHTACPLSYLFGLGYQSIWVANITHTFQDCFTPTVAIILTTTPAPLKLYKGIWVNELLSKIYFVNERNVTYVTILSQACFSICGKWYPIAFRWSVCITCCAQQDFIKDFDRSKAIVSSRCTQDTSDYNPNPIWRF